MKRVLINTALICTVSLSSVNVQAAIIDRVHTEGAMVISEGTGVAADSVFPVTVIKNGQDTKQLTEINPPVFYQGEIVSDSAGKTQLKFKMPASSESGEYIIRIFDGNKIENFGFTYYSTSARQLLIDKINTGIKSEIEDVLKNGAEMLGLHLADTAEIGTSGIAERIYTEISENSSDVTGKHFTEESFLEFYKKAVVLEAFTQGKIDFLTENGLLIYDEYTKISSSKLYTEYKENLSSMGREIVNKGVTCAGCNDEGEIFEAFERNTAFALITAYKDNGYGHVNRIFSEYRGTYRNLLKIDFTYYDKLNSSEKTTFARTLNVENISSPERLKEKFESTAKNLYKKESQTGGGSGGSGGGGGSSAKVDVSIPSGVQPTKKIEFKDLEDAEWARESIVSLAEKNIVNGKSDGLFFPNDNITREEFSKMVCLAFKIETNGATCEFSDVKSDAWYYPYISALVKSGAINGIDSKTFGTGMNITREQMATIIARIANITALSENKFADDENISEYAKSHVYAMKEHGVINGIGENLFNPKGFATRAEAAKVVCGAMNKFAKQESN